MKEALFLGSGVALGLLGSGHCLGMCGPLVVAFPGRTGRWMSHVQYHSGRLLTYGALGGVMGGMGGVMQADALPRLQLGVMLAAAVFLVMLGGMRLGLWREPRWLSWSGIARFPGLRRLVRLDAGQGQGWRSFALGLLFGFLPCALSMAAFMVALSTRSMGWGAAYAVAFGIGTLPSLLALGSVLGVWLRRWREHGEALSGVMMVAMGVGYLVDLWVS